MDSNLTRHSHVYLWIKEDTILNWKCGMWSSTRKYAETPAMFHLTAADRFLCDHTPYNITYITQEMWNAIYF